MFGLEAPGSGSFLGNEGSTREFGTAFIQGVTRELGLASAIVSPAFLADRVRAIGAVVQGQAAFQHKVALRYEAVERVLGRIGITLFVPAILFYLLDVVRALSPGLAELLKIHGFSGFHIATAAAILPSLGAALAGLAAQGEYKRLAVRGRLHEQYSCKSSTRTQYAAHARSSYAASVRFTRRRGPYLRGSGLASSSRGKASNPAHMKPAAWLKPIPADCRAAVLLQSLKLLF